MNNEQKYLVFINIAFSSKTRKVDYDKATDTLAILQLLDSIVSIGAHSMFSSNTMYSSLDYTSGGGF
ncbi:MAG: hypothetical protein LBU65_17450 [Planctomycetaceae bacterium]|jgi:hypothetical protein|nr:hypothetical protein [Planctomycetaceae bacterium]